MSACWILTLNVMLHVLLDKFMDCDATNEMVIMLVFRLRSLVTQCAHSLLWLMTYSVHKCCGISMGMETNVVGLLWACVGFLRKCSSVWLLWCTCSNRQLFSNCWMMFAVIWTVLHYQLTLRSKGMECPDCRQMLIYNRNWIQAKIEDSSFWIVIRCWHKDAQNCL